jgi:TRAP-type C4-dicarboxylate transport system permease small subunit
VTANALKGLHLAPQFDVMDISASRDRLVRIQRVLAKIGAATEMLALVFGGLFLALISVSLLLQVVYRYVLFQPLPWSEEVARFGLVWLGMLAAVVAARRGLHFIFRFGTLLLPATARRLLRVAVNFLVVVFLAILVAEGWVYLGIVQNQTAPATGLNMVVPYSSVVVGGLMMLAIYMTELGDAILSVFSGHRYSELEAQELTVYEQLGRWRDGQEMLASIDVPPTRPSEG